ncbi:hypothetical protein ACHAQA_006257 [Verticillium albo-atrum]
MRSTVSSTANDPARTPSTKLKQSSSRASKSTISTMLRKSRRDIAQRAETANDALDAAALREKMKMMDADSPLPSPTTGWPEPALLPRETAQTEVLPPPGIRRKPVQKQRQSIAKQRQSFAKQRQSVASTMSSGGASIASSSVLSPELMSYYTPSMKTTSLHQVSLFPAPLPMEDRPLPPLPSTVYKPFRRDQK